MNSTESAFSESIDSLRLSGRKVIVAFSGGCDSLALLVLCVRTLGEGSVFPVYVNHNIRPRAEIEAEIALNRANCKKLGLELKVMTLDEGLVKSLAKARHGGIEDAARVLRYQALERERVRSGYDYIMTAHHRQDQIETIIMRLASGSPVTSLGGIARKDEIRHLARPLLEFSRPALEEYLRLQDFSWSTDSSNSDTSFERNRIRNEVLPKIQAIWPDHEKVLLDLADKGGMNPVSSEMESVFGMWDRLFPDKELPMTLLERIMKAKSGKENAVVSANGVTFTLYEGRAFLTCDSDNALFQSFEASVEAGRVQCLSLPGNLEFRVMEKSDDSLALCMDTSRFEGETRLRFARIGDSIDLKGGRKKVMRLLQDMKIPPVLRQRVPILEDKDGVCAVFARVYGGKDRICVKFCSLLAPNGFPIYIVC